jgi:FkbM family methyltransferase
MLRRSGTKRRTLILLAGRARDARQWDIAAQYYRQSLDLDPHNWAIRVQYGHALKESGHLAEAEAAYWRALADAPDVADSHLQLGHVLKLQGKTEEAKAAYLRALLMYDRLANQPLQELAGLGWSGSELSERTHWNFVPAEKKPKVEPIAIVDDDPWKVFQRKDVVMRNIFDRLVQAIRPDIICDIGSFNGEESARFRRIAPESRVYAFEANKHNIANFINPRPDLERVTVEYTAVCEVDGEISFHILDVDHPFSEWRRAAGSLNDRTDDITSVSVTVPSVRLDTYFRNEIEAKSTFILWMDVEGALDRVFAGARKVLSQTILFRAEVERHEFWAGQKMADEVIAEAEAAGFVLLGDSWTPEAQAQSDVLMINRQWLHLVANSANNVKSPT